LNRRAWMFERRNSGLALILAHRASGAWRAVRQLDERQVSRKFVK
jgi:hypothetical protein